MQFGHFDNRSGGYVITNPETPRPWINYLGNRRLRAFISQNAGGLLWHMEPYSRRITRYHYTAAPGDRPGFYLYVRDHNTGEVWNPHFAPTCTALDTFSCRHRPGVTEFVGCKDGVEVCLTLGIPPGDDVLLWDVAVRNVGSTEIDIELVSYLEFGLLEFMREAVGWCYLKNQFGLHYDAELGAIRYDYHVFEAPYAPRMLFGCSEAVTGWECSRDAFIGTTGSYESPAALRPGHELSNSNLPLGGHACAVQGVPVRLVAGAERHVGFCFALADAWAEAEDLFKRYQQADAVASGIAAIDQFWASRLQTAPRGPGILPGAPLEGADAGEATGGTPVPQDEPTWHGHPARSPEGREVDGGEKEMSTAPALSQSCLPLSHGYGRDARATGNDGYGRDARATGNDGYGRDARATGSPTTVCTGDPVIDAMINTWIPYNSIVALDLARTISTDHMGTDGLRYRDTMQDALAVANIDPDFALLRMRQVFAQQTPEGGGCFSFFPDDPRPTSDVPRRCDNTVWPVYTVYNYLAETGAMGFLDEEIPYRDGTSGTVYEHMLKGLRYIHDRRGPNGLPTLYHADWNDGLALFQDEAAESVMLGMQMVYACKLFRELAHRQGRGGDADWCGAVIAELTVILNSDIVWDGRWYRRLLLSNGKCLGSAANAQGRIYLNPQSWAVISGIGDFEDRGRIAMAAVVELLDSEAGLQILTPPFKGIPEPEDPPLGSNPGIGENGGIFCHANTWAIIAECLLGNGDRAWKYFRQMLPPVVAEKFGGAHYQREPYVFVSSIIGPVSDRFGEGGISWLTGTANWMHVAALHYILGIRPTLDGELEVTPCLPAAIPLASVRRTYRGKTYHVELRRKNGDSSYTIRENAPL